MLRATDISKSFGSVRLLSKICLDVHPGQIVELRGGNGSGKTTLIDILSGRVAPDSGTIFLDGKAVRSRASKPTQGLFRTYQVPRVFDQLTVDENRDLGVWEGAASDLHTRPLRVPGSQSGFTLSVGQRRRVVLGWLEARLASCKYFLLDEPTAGADSEFVQQLKEFVQRARSNGAGFIIVEHNRALLDTLSDGVLFLEQGILSEAPPEERGVSATATGQRREAVRGEGPSLLQCSGLSVSRGRAKILTDVDLEVPKGGCLAITGPNGCGKSTLLHALYGSPNIHVTQGSIRYAGDDIADTSHHHRLRLGFAILPQEATGFESMSLREVLALFGSSTHGEKIARGELARLDRLYETFPGIADIIDRRYGELSGGQRRLFGLARALAPNPNILLLDEPLAGLDSSARKIVVDVIKRIVDTGVSTVVVEQSDHIDALEHHRKLIMEGRGTLSS